MDTLELERLKSTIAKIQETSTQSLKVTNSNARLRKRISIIHDTFLSNWENEYLPEIQNLNGRIRQGIPTPVLTVCGRGTQEIRWTKYLSYFLNPTNNHGLSDLLCRMVIDSIIADDNISYGDYRILEVRDEVSLGEVIAENKSQEKESKDSVCDIVITTDKFTLFCEQKILSSESNALTPDLTQLCRYTKAIDQNITYSKLHKIKIYLTPTGKLPKNACGWKPWRHSDIIDSCIRLLKNPNLSTIAHDNLRRFTIDLALGSSNQTERIITMMKTLSDDLIENGFKLYPYLQLSNLNTEHPHLTKIIKGEIS